MSDGSNFVVAVGIGPDSVDAATDAARRARAALGEQSASLVVMFASASLCEDPWSLLDAVHRELQPQHLIGCTAEAVIGDDQELEGTPAISLWCAHLPGIDVDTFRLSHDDDPDEVTGWPVELAGTADPVIVLADPFTLRTDNLLERHNAQGGGPIIGGLASGGQRPGEHALFLDRDVHFDGGVGVQLPGAPIVTVVSQGCAPIGPDMVITSGGGPMVAELAGATAFDKIVGVVDELPDDERQLLQQPLLAGLVINENQPDYDRGDFLVRGIHGRDPDTGAIYIGEHIRVGQTFRLHVRDAASADEDLRLALQHARRRAEPLNPAAALMFTCNGRGTHMFGERDHDAMTVAQELGVPTAGMFCNGEIGPIGGRTFLHGFTATMAVFLQDDVAFTSHTASDM